MTDQQAYMDHILEEAKEKEIELSSETLDTITWIRIGPPIEDYWNNEHPIWTGIKWLRSGCLGDMVNIPTDAQTRLLAFIGKIRNDCTNRSINPVSRASGLFTLAHICFWKYRPIGLPPHPQQNEHPLWSLFRPSDENHALEKAMTAISRSMDVGERELVFGDLFHVDVLNVFHDLDAIAKRSRTNPPPFVQLEHVVGVFFNEPSRVSEWENDSW